MIPFSTARDINSPIITSDTEKNPISVQFKWIDDDGSFWTNSDDDGLIPYVPPIEQVPLEIQFQIIKDNNTYFGQENQQHAMDNITVSGDTLFTGTLDKIPEVSFINGTTWNVPVIPTMYINGGEINFTVTAWNTTISEKLSIDKEFLFRIVVKITPMQFFFGKDQIFIAQVTDFLNGYGFTNAHIYVCYIGDVDGGIPGDPIENHMLIHIPSGGTTNGEYEFGINSSQQSINQTLAGFDSVKARRNLSVYVKLYRGGTPAYVYGYAKTEMKPILAELEYELKGCLGITLFVTNNGPEHFQSGIFYNYTINGPIALTKYGNGSNLISLEPNETEKFAKIIIIALGPFIIKINVTTNNTNYFIEEKGFALGVFVILFKGMRNKYEEISCSRIHSLVHSTYI